MRWRENDALSTPVTHVASVWLTFVGPAKGGRWRNGSQLRGAPSPLSNRTTRSGGAKVYPYAYTNGVYGHGRYEVHTTDRNHTPHRCWQATIPRGQDQHRFSSKRAPSDSTTVHCVPVRPHHASPDVMRIVSSGIKRRHRACDRVRYLLSSIAGLSESCRRPEPLE